MGPLLNGHALRVLRAAREVLAPDAERLAVSRVPREEERRVLRPVLRQWSVGFAAYWCSPLRYAQWCLLVLGSLVVLLAPVAAVVVPAVRALAVDERVLAGAVYLVVFGAMGTTFFRYVGAVIFVWLGLAGTSICAVAVLLIAWRVSMWPAVGYGLIGGVLGGLAILAGSLSVKIM